MVVGRGEEREDLVPGRSGHVCACVRVSEWMEKVYLMLEATKKMKKMNTNWNLSKQLGGLNLNHSHSRIETMRNCALRLLSNKFIHPC